MAETHEFRGGNITRTIQFQVLKWCTKIGLVNIWKFC